MKALTLTQPWATLVAIGAKQVETRSWRTTYRGPIAIHAAKTFPRQARNLCCTEPFAFALQRARLLGQPAPADSVGMVLCICDLWACKPTEDIAPVLGAYERAFGDYNVGRYAWGLRIIRVLPQPVPAKGALGLWEWTPTEGNRA
jgi:hypothetical protein